MALGEALQKRLEELQKKDPYIRQRLWDIAREATYQAVMEATDQTPPNCDEKARGTGMITGRMAQCWKKHSQIQPTISGGQFLTVLENRVGEDDSEDASASENNVSYASYVNDGHHLYPHFVPGLMVDPATGLLERVDPEIPEAGLKVGTKTSWVPGLHITDKAMDKYKEVAEFELVKLMKEVFGP